MLRYTHAGFCASRWRYAPFSGKMRCGARGRLASLGAVPCGGCMVRSACAIFCAASAGATPVRRRVQRQCSCCVQEPFAFSTRYCIALKAVLPFVLRLVTRLPKARSYLRMLVLRTGTCASLDNRLFQVYALTVRPPFHPTCSSTLHQCCFRRKSCETPPRSRNSIQASCKCVIMFKSSNTK